MGKKSKKKAAAKAESGAASGAGGEPSDTASAGGGDAVAGLNPAAITRNKKKKTRCMSCRCLVKDTSKAHACPGCSIVYCWRCERREFQACPNGEICVHPIRRCGPCTSGFTLAGIMKTFCSDEDWNAIPPPTEEHVELFEKKYLADRDTANNQWSVDTLPFQVCGGDGCKESECRRCFTDPSAVRRLMRCFICCGNARCEGCFATYEQRLSLTIMKAAERKGILVPEGAFELISEEDLGDIRSIFLADIPDVIVSCTRGGCNFVGCLECLDHSSMERCLRNVFLDGPNFRCNNCYWSVKPCINSKCPNEPGVPTKRCGNCHLARYCSVECQAADYPAHVGRCQKIKEKRMVARGLAKVSED